MNFLMACVMVNLLGVQSQVSQNKAQTKSVCIESSSLEVALTCEKQWIHVISKICANETIETGCPDSSSSCVISLTNDDDGMDVKCNGRNDCAESARSPGFCTVRACKFVYECIEGSMDICSPVKSKCLNSSVYLHTSGFPKSNGSCSRCSCRVYGARMTVTVVEHHAEEGVVTISTDKTDVWASNSTHYNKVIASGTSEVVVNYESKGPNGRAWINVAGDGSLLVSCEKGLANHIAPNLWNSSPSGATSEMTSQQNTIDNGTTEIDTSLSPLATAGLGALCGFLLGIVFAVGVAVLFRRKRKLYEAVVLLRTRFKERGSSHKKPFSYKKEQNHCIPTLNVDVEHPIEAPTTSEIAAVEGPSSVLEPPVTDGYTKVLPRGLRPANNSNKNNQVTAMNQSDVSSQLLTPQTTGEIMFNNCSSDKIYEEVGKNISPESSDIHTKSSLRNKCCDTNYAVCMSFDVSCEVMKSSVRLTSAAEGSNGSCEDITISDLSCGGSSTPANHCDSTNATVTSQTDMNPYDFVDGGLDPRRDQISEGNLSDDQSQAERNVTIYEDVCGDAQRREKREFDDLGQSSRGYAVGVQTSVDSHNTEGSFCSGETSTKDGGAHAVTEDAELGMSTHSEDIALNNLSYSYSSIPDDHYTSSNSANTSQTDQNLYDFVDEASDQLDIGDASNKNECAQVGSDGDYAAIEDAELCVRSHPQPDHLIYEDIAVVEKLN